MSLLRTSAPRSLLASARPIMNISVRTYAGGPGGSDTGATASSTGFKNREQGQEKEYIVRAEQDKLKKLREQLAKQRKHLDDVETAINDLHGESGNKKQ
ncbi:hypothetical protein BCV69DRAFT_298833 [Microstroma glucosiphilum]|uniref:ATPase inhibitor, mitochondrial n=1 Tax=Pseudomicrostroma glucosiphilum TaxID=1684307 RepID=A0A316U776_9BASI|nr:hypothetical protein BCV69DRAFT_298833 [Pseudomicrostroma glucosiphilum]PWN21042.1 hypothetical protein BCV69DRAFT_298833 [Pseudomicrostroma glucosiphilum]